MEGKQPATRMRRKHHKVATGCANCKRRRVKCDETQEGCQRCQQANLFCPGYAPPKARIFEPSSSGDASASENSLAQYGRGRSASFSPLGTNKGLDLRVVWQSALLDSFLTTWLPGTLAREYSRSTKPEILAPMSGWVFTTWRLAKEKDESFAAHAVLCLTLCVIGTQTGDGRFLEEAARHYARVLSQFQAQISRLAKTGYSAHQDDHVASLAAAGFCCSQVEYILQSWSNGDKHLEGMESLLKACGPAALRHEDTRRIFYDHLLLWTSCAVTHHQPAIYSQSPWNELDWAGLPGPCKSLLQLAEQIPLLLHQHDAVQQRDPSVDASQLLRQLIDMVLDMQTVLAEANEFYASAEPACSKGSTNDLSTNFLNSLVMVGYASAFKLHAGIATWELIHSGYADLSSVTRIDLAPDALQKGCEVHVNRICGLIDQLANDRFAMITTSPLLFLLDTAWMAHEALSKFCGRDLDVVKPWFVKIGAHVTGIGYRPLREPWVDSNFEPAAPSMQLQHFTLST